MNEDQKNLPLSIQRDNQRRADAFPTRDSHTFFPGSGRKQAEGNDRIRNHKVAELRSFFQRAKGRDATPAEIAQHLGEELPPQE